VAAPNAFTTYPALVGSILAALRKQAAPGLTQQQLADAVGVSISTWSRIETGETALTVEQLAMAANKLGTSPGALLGAADIKLIELWAKGIATTWQREEGEAASSMIRLTGASLSRSIGDVQPAGITPTASIESMAKFFVGAKDGTVRLASDLGKKAGTVGAVVADLSVNATTDIGKRVSEIGDKIADLTGSATKSVSDLMKKKPKP
jgi:transcriptional regulator with XRE-family HTH domain